MTRKTRPDSPISKRIRCLVGASLIAWSFFLELCQLSDRWATSLIIANSTMILIVSLSNFFSPETTKNLTNISFSLLALLFLYKAPSEISTAQIITMINIIIIGIEDYHFIHRISHFLMSGLWIGAQQFFLPQSDSKELGFFVVNLLLIVAIASIGRFYLIKTTEESSPVIHQHKEKIQELEAQINGLKEALNEKDNYMYVFSHEARNPLHVLLANISFLLKDVESHQLNLKQMKTRLTRAKFCGELLLKNLNNVLDSGKLTTKGSLEITPNDVKVHEYLQSITDFMELLLKKNELKPELIIPHPLPALLKFDSHRLSQVVLNLLTNAAKFTTTGSISLKVSYLAKENLEESDFLPNSVFGHLLASETEDEQAAGLSPNTNASEDPLGFNDYYSQELRRGFLSLEEKRREMKRARTQKKGFLKLEMNDTGSGMTKDQLQKLFQKFSQPNSDQSQTKIGTGLGLWIVKTLCELMQGGVRCYSRRGIGSSFVVVIRADLVPSRSEGERTEAYRRSPCLASKNGIVRVLLADGDELNLQSITENLNSIGVSLIEAVQNGKEVVERFMSKPEGYYQAIIINTELPSISGIETATLIREYEVQKNRKQLSKIGFFTNKSDSHTKQACQTQPINCWFYTVSSLTLKFLQESFSSAGLSDRKPQLLSSYRQRDRRHSLLKIPQVLCVDDDEFNLEVLDEILSDLGAQVLKVKSGDEALELVRSGKYKIDLVLLDCMMPGMDGRETCRRIKQLIKSEDRDIIPIVGVTGDTRRNKPELEENFGMDGIFEKPISREQISKLLKKYT